MKKTAMLKPGDHVRLSHFGDTKPRYQLKCLTHGLRVGVEARFVRVAPLGCPIQLEINGVSLILRYDEAKDLCWEAI